jgi:hypothetical protein
MAESCKKCLGEFDELIKIDAGMRLRLQEINNEAHEYPAVCNGCFNILKDEINHGAKLMAEQNQIEQNKAALWKNRVTFIKEARERMQARSFSEAAVQYEKYLRALEVCYDIPAGQLDPLIFNAPGKTGELTILCTVYWDLFKIYDASDKYLDRQKMVGDKLLSIIPHASVQSDLMKKAERFIKDAKNKDNAREFMLKLREATGATGCFIATASFGSYSDDNVLVLRQFRDQVLMKSSSGRKFIHLYYAVSPSIAVFIQTKPWLKSLTRSLIAPIAMLLAKKFNLK